MSNTSKGRANKGSKYQMQNLSMEYNQHYLEERLGDSLYWISPRQDDNFGEYQLNSPKIKEQLGIPSNAFYHFWPSRQPQWDGIALGENTLFLFEAKSYFDEIQPGKDGKSKGNNIMKYKAIVSAAHELFGIKFSRKMEEVWSKTFYQIANRIVFLKKMKELAQNPQTRFDNVVLVFLNFINDKTWLKEGKMVKSEKEWNDHYDKILFLMGVNRQQLQDHNILICNLDASQLRG